VKYALLSDVHANLPALDAVLGELARSSDVVATYHLGDLVGYAPWPNEVVGRLGRPNIYAGARHAAQQHHVLDQRAARCVLPKNGAGGRRQGVFAGALVTGPLAAGSFNPARTLGPALVGGVWTPHWLYWAAPV